MWFVALYWGLNYHTGTTFDSRNNNYAFVAVGIQSIGRTPSQHLTSHIEVPAIKRQK